MTGTDDKALDADKPGLMRAARGPVLAGLAVVGVFFLGLGGWAAVAPIASAAIAPGVLSPDGSRRVVQHLEGGIIAEILVKDGDEVSEGDPLVVLDKTQATAANDVVFNRTVTSRAVQARLMAELRGAEEIDWPPVIADNMDRTHVRDTVAAQTELFNARIQSHARRKDILNARVGQLQEEITGLQQEIAGQTAQLGFLAEQIADQESLLADGFTRKSLVLDLKSRHAGIGGAKGRNQAEVARARQQIGETQLQIQAIDSERLDEINSQLTEVNASIADLEERKRTSEDVLDRTVIVAPVSGRVVNLRFATRGGVIRAGEPILDIVPNDEELLIDARVRPTDIDMVQTGLEAQVVFSAFKQRNLPRMQGQVRTVSADALTDPDTSQTYYSVRVEVSAEELERLPADARLVAGMPVEVFIQTGDNTLLGYLTEPMTAAMRRGMRED